MVLGKTTSTLVQLITMAQDQYTVICHALRYKIIKSMNVILDYTEYYHIVVNISKKFIVYIGHEYD